ncbi:fibrillarin-like rRNA/tRNA 2'-O-methyltransferase [Candidatus Woesearchaeota archaeon]|nr:fibrillarin-like rRNA/tRNA 2'-O-methyltransferase [Candidatus Woesearchaeota archaeon]
MQISKTNYQGIFIVQNKRKLLVTKNLTGGKKFFDEKLIQENNNEYREINPFRSKLAAATIKKISTTAIKEGDKILYLGASHGYTPSYISDIIGNKGIIFCIDFAPRVVRDLLFICEERENMMPILADANKPEIYKNRITQVDIIYQDIAQKNQVEILLKNLEFLKPKGYALIAIKARSIDVTKSPQKIYREVEEQLKQKLKVIDKKELDPLQKDHCFFVCQKK